MSDKIVLVQNRATGVGPCPWFESALANAFAQGFELCDGQKVDSAAIEAPAKEAGKLVSDSTETPKPAPVQTSAPSTPPTSTDETQKNGSW